MSGSGSSIPSIEQTVASRASRASSLISRSLALSMIISLWVSLSNMIPPILKFNYISSKRRDQQRRGLLQ